jgi:hypothetical protein
MSNVDELYLSNEPSRIHSAFNSFKSEAEILSSPENSSDIRTRGIINHAGVTVEQILKYIIKKENKSTASPEQKFKGLNELKQIVAEIIPKQPSIHLNTIIHWRNVASHHDGQIKLSEYELKGVESALEAFVVWFFEEYLQGQYADFSKNSYKVATEQTSAKNERENFHTKIASNIGVSETSTNYQKKNSTRTIFILLSIVISISLIVAFYYNSKDEPLVQNKSLTTNEQVYNFLTDYFNSSNDKESNAKKFFAEKVDIFYRRINVSPSEIEIIRRKNIDFLDAKTKVDKRTLYLYSKDGKISYWRFWADFTCYRPSKKAFQNGRVEYEFGINDENKITRIKEVTVPPQHYSKEKPI